MTLHDRIMGLIPDDITNGGEEFYDGFAEASRKAATLAKEADELMAEMAGALEQAVLSMQDSGYRNDSVAVRAGRQAVNKYKESKQ